MLIFMVLCSSFSPTPQRRLLGDDDDDDDDEEDDDDVEAPIRFSFSTPLSSHQDHASRSVVIYGHIGTADM